jgi:hypothetical protein
MAKQQLQRSKLQLLLQRRQQLLSGTQRSPLRDSLAADIQFEQDG